MNPKCQGRVLGCETCYCIISHHLHFCYPPHQKPPSRGTRESSLINNIRRYDYGYYKIF